MMSRQTYLFLGPLFLGVVACGAAASPGPVHESLVKGPTGPVATASASSTALPPDSLPLEVADKNKEKKPLGLLEQPPDDRDQEEGMVLGPSHPIAAAPPPPPPADPLAVSPPARGASSHQGEGKGGFGGGVPDGGGGAGKTGQIGAASEVRGSIDKEEIRKVVMAHVSEVKRCYDQGLARTPTLEGRVVLKFIIGKTGTVTATTVQETSMNDRQVEQCMVSASTKWTFPKPKGEGTVTFTYPFTLKSGG